MNKYMNNLQQKINKNKRLYPQIRIIINNMATNLQTSSEVYLEQKKKRERIMKFVIKNHQIAQKWLKTMSQILAELQIINLT